MNKIKRLLRWLPIIWNDQDWDYGFLYVILRHKLSMMAEFFASDLPHLEGAREVEDQLNYCIHLIDRITTYNYYEEYDREHKEMWGEKHMDFVDIDDDLCEVVMRYERDLTDEEYEIAEEMARINSVRAVNDKERDRNKLFQFISDHIEGWWD